MNQHFEFGPTARGIYIALISVASLVPLVSPTYFIHYVIFLIFVGFGLGPFFVKTGLFGLWNNICTRVREKWDRKYLAKRASEIDRRVELEKYRKSRYRDPRLPKNC